MFKDGESTEAPVQDDDFKAEKPKLVAELKAFTDREDRKPEGQIKGDRYIGYIKPVYLSPWYNYFTVIPFLRGSVFHRIKSNT
jgi:hypothetical protein